MLASVPMTKLPVDKRPVDVRINGSRNHVAPFPTTMGKLFIGGMAPARLLDESSVLLTAEGKTENGEFIDVELAIPVSQVPTLIALLMHRAEPHLESPTATAPTSAE